MPHILIINKSYSVIKALKQTLEREKDMRVLHQATDSKTADQILQCSHKEIDLILLDAQLENWEPSGLIYANYLRQRFPDLKILMFSFQHSGAYVFHMHKAGVHGFLFQESGPIEIVKAIRTIHQGKLYYKGKVKIALERYRQFLSCSKEEQIYMSPLELEFIQGLANLESMHMKYSPEQKKSSSREAIWKSITYKLGTSDPDKILEIAYHNGWISFLILNSILLFPQLCSSLVI